MYFAPSAKLVCVAYYVNYTFPLRQKLCYKDSVTSSPYLNLANYIDKSFFSSWNFHLVNQGIVKTDL